MSYQKSQDEGFTELLHKGFMDARDMYRRSVESPTRIFHKNKPTLSVLCTYYCGLKNEAEIFSQKEFDELYEDNEKKEMNNVSNTDTLSTSGKVRTTNPSLEKSKISNQESRTISDRNESESHENSFSKKKEMNMVLNIRNEFDNMNMTNIKGDLILTNASTNLGHNIANIGYIKSSFNNEPQNQLELSQKIPGTRNFSQDNNVEMQNMQFGEIPDQYKNYIRECIQNEKEQLKALKLKLQLFILLVLSTELILCIEISFLGLKLIIIVLLKLIQLK